MKKPGYVQFDFNTTVFTANGDFPIDPLCNNLTLWNQGTAACVVRGIPIPAGTAVQIGGNQNEIFNTRIQIAFTTAGTQQLVIIQKFYTPELDGENKNKGL